MNLKYRPEIDGLRAIAVVSVVFFHAGFKFFSGGFIGVDVFFVISGFLITQIILSDLSNNKFSILTFYERRIRRIIPMIFLIMFISFIFSWFILMPSDMVQFTDSIFSVSFFSSNFLFYKEAGYWDISSELKPLLHTWTLAVEEQFYFIFPILLILGNHINKKLRLIFLLALIIISFFFAEWASKASENSATFAFYLLPARAWELGFGALIALCVVNFPDFYNKLNGNRVTNEFLSIIGFGLILFPVFYYDQNTPFPGVFTIAPIFGTGILLVFCMKSTISYSILSNKFIVQIGLMSYSIYLWHQPIFSFCRYISFPEPSNLLVLALTISIFPLSYFSWRFVENYFRNKDVISKKFIFTMFFSGTFIFVIIGILGRNFNGFIFRNVVDNVKILKYQPDNVILREESWEMLRTLSNDSSYQRENNEFDRKLWFDLTNDKRKLLVVGNSHSKDVFNSLIFNPKINLIFDIARFGIKISDLNEVDHLFFNTPNYVNSDIVMFASKYSREDLEILDDLIKRVLRDGKKVVLVKSIFEFSNFGNRNLADFYVKKFVNSNTDINKYSVDSLVNEINKAYYQEYNNSKSKEFQKDVIIDNIGDVFPEIIILDRMQYICNDNSKTCYAINNDLEKFFFDYGHNTKAGAIFFGNRIEEVGWLQLINDN